MGCSSSGVEAREDADTLVIYQSKYTQSPDGTVGPTDVDRLAGAANYFASSATSLPISLLPGPEATPPPAHRRTRAGTGSFGSRSDARDPTCAHHDGHPQW